MYCICRLDSLTALQVGSTHFVTHFICTCHGSFKHITRSAPQGCPGGSQGGISVSSVPRVQGVLLLLGGTEVEHPRGASQRRSAPVRRASGAVPPLQPPSLCIPPHSVLSAATREGGAHMRSKEREHGCMRGVRWQLEPANTSSPARQPTVPPSSLTDALQTWRGKGREGAVSGARRRARLPHGAWRRLAGEWSGVRHSCSPPVTPELRQFTRRQHKPK